MGINNVNNIKISKAIEKGYTFNSCLTYMQ